MNFDIQFHGWSWSGGGEFRDGLATHGGLDQMERYGRRRRRRSRTRRSRRGEDNGGVLETDSLSEKKETKIVNIEVINVEDV